MKKEVVYAFIDSQNLNLGTKNSGWTLDFKKFRNYLRTKYNVTKAYLFIGFVQGNSHLYQQLQEYGYLLIFKPVLEIVDHGKKTYKGNVDAELVLHTMIQLPNYAKAIVVSGDGDFFCLVEYLEKEGRLLKVIVPNSRFSSLLRKYASFILPVSLLKEKLQLKKR
jgi:uncharacterized LabA/DUF88 family protein